MQLKKKLAQEPPNFDRHWIFTSKYKKYDKILCLLVFVQCLFMGNLWYFPSTLLYCCNFYVNRIAKFAFTIFIVIGTPHVKLTFRRKGFMSWRFYCWLYKKNQNAFYERKNVNAEVSAPVRLFHWPINRCQNITSEKKNHGGVNI